MTFTRVEREPAAILCATEEGAPGEAGPRAFERLEQALPTHRGRRFYGFFDAVHQRYVACVERQEDDDAAALGLEEAELPGGFYLRARLRGEAPAVYAQIGPTFDELAQAADVDPTRPWLEFYRRHDEVDVLLPVSP